MNNTMDITSVMKQINDTAAKNVEEIRFVKNVKVGWIGRQGDIYIHCVKSNHGKGKLLSNGQLAQGTSKGSRHIADGKSQAYEGSTRPTYCSEEVFLGPCVVSTERFTVTHPEHADVCLPAGTYQITHQMDARTLERVRD